MKVEIVLRQGQEITIATEEPLEVQIMLKERADHRAIPFGRSDMFRGLSSSADRGDLYQVMIPRIDIWV